MDLTWFYDLLMAAAVAVVLLTVATLVLIRLCSQPKPHIIRYDDEKLFISSTSKGQSERLPFPFVGDRRESTTTTSGGAGTINLSVIIPAYNEELRLPIMLDEALDYLEKRAKSSSFRYEVIVVDDGSYDRTTAVALEYVARYGSDKFRVLTLSKNRGKGGAVRLGALSSRGQLVLFADADGATKFSELDKLEKALRDASDSSIAIGSRAHLEQEAIATRSALRTFLMHGFHFIVWFFAVRTVRDTQCGFKLFERPVANVLFQHIHVERWAFDVELLHIAEHLGLRVMEVAVKWTEIEGSKIVPVFSWLQMGRDVFKIFLMYKIGAWALPKRTKDQ